jgi:PAS domain S-box-containing protein
MMRTLGQICSGLRFRLLVVVVVACVPPVLLTLQLAREERQREMAVLRQRLREMVQLGSRKEDEMIAGTRQLLRTLAESSQVQSGHPAACSQLLRAIFADYPRYANLGVIRTNGEVLASALAPPAAVNLADRPYVQRALATRALSIGDYQIGRITGKPTINFGYPVLNSSDQVQAVVFAALDLDWLSHSDYVLQALLPKGGTWTKIDARGTILVRHPAPERWLGRPLPEQALLPALLAQRNGLIDETDQQGQVVLHAFGSTRSALVAGDVLSILSVPRKVLLAEADQRLRRNLTAVGILAGLVLVLGWTGSRYLILRPIQALVDFGARLGSGDQSARTGLPRARDELRQLAAVLDQMAQALELRAAESERAATQLRQSEARFRALVQHSSDVIGILDARGAILYHSPNLQTILGCDPAEAREPSLFNYFRPEDRTRAQARLAQLLRTPGGALRDEYRLRQRDGSDRFIEAICSNHLDDPAIGGIVFNFRDITKRKRAEARLRESSQRLHEVSRRLVEVQEAERRHIARELHDEIGQALTATELNLQTLLETPGADTVTPRLRQTLQAVERVQEQVRDLSLNLRPSMLDDLGLEPALRWYTERQAGLAGLQAEVQADPLERRLDPAIETECFRVAQQALTNVVKHAKARTVIVELSKNTDEQQLHLSVRDDGVGFEVDSVRAQAVRGASLGLLSMEERATLAGGGLEFHSTPGRGTEVHAWFPLKWAHPPVLIGAV